MASPYLGEIRVFTFGFTPQGWALCNGQLLPLNQNQALFSLLGTTFGGDGVNNFALPNYQGRVPVHAGSGYVLGQSAGSTTATLLLTNLPSHTHVLNASSGAATTRSPAGNSLAAPARNGPAMYVPAAPNANMANGAVGTTGAGSPFSTLQPTLCLNFCIALVGIFPSRD